MLGVILTIIACYLLFRFIFGFVIPVVMATRNVRSKMKEMNKKMADFEADKTPPNSSGRNFQSSPTAGTPSKGDYIDFEEVK